jgi:hypothetical protein
MFDEKKGAAQSTDSIVAANTPEKNGGKFDADTAAAEFVSYCEANDIDCDEAAMKEEDQEGFKQIKEHFIKACKQGRVVVDGTSVTYTVSDLSPQGYAREQIKISRPGGQAFMAMDSFKDNQSVHRLQAFCSAMTGKEVKYFSKLDIVDWRFFRDIAILFLST